MTKRLAIILTSVIVGAVLIGSIIVAVAVGGLNATNQEADYRACVAAGGLYDTTDDEEKAAIAGRCYDSIYGE